MERDYFLKTERIAFSRWQQDDLPLALRLWGDVEVSRYITANPPYTGDMVAERLRGEMATQANAGLQYWPLFRREDGAFMGCCGLRPYEPGIPELGFHLLPDYWGGGYAGEAARAALDYGFAVMGAKAVFARHNPDNLRSAQRLVKLGFERIGEEVYPPTGRLHPTYILTLENLQAQAAR